MQKGGWTLPCKEPLGWFLALKQSYDSLSYYVAKSLCWKQWTVHAAARASSKLPPLHDKSVIQYAMPQTGCSNQQHLTTLPPCTWGMLQSWGESKADRNWVCCVCVSVTETQRVGTGRNRKPRQAFTLEEFPACKMCITVFLQLRRGGERGGRTRKESCAFERHFKTGFRLTV